MRRRILWTFLVFVVPLAPAAEPQTNTNVVAAAEDAFGISLGPESLGLYNAGSVRGFSPLAAGNLRLNGLYFDQQGQTIERLVNETRIRVGLSAVNFPWPAPTGIVDYLLRRPEDSRALSSIFYFGPYQNREVDLDGHESFWNGRVGIAAGASYHTEEDLPGWSYRVTSFGLLPQWTPGKDLVLRAFWGRRSVFDQPTQPTLYLDGGQSPQRVPQRYFGQNWTAADYSTEDYGALVSARLNQNWTVRAGVFRSLYDVPRSHLDLYLNTSSDGIGDHVVVAEPDQSYNSTSGEVQLAYALAGKSWHQEVIFGVRGRNTRSLYGGADSVDFGLGVDGKYSPISRPNFVFGNRTVDRVREYSPEASYSVGWNRYVYYTVGIQRPDYIRLVADPGSGNSTSVVRPSLYNSSLVVRPTMRLTLFGALTRGLEDAGIAPANASNRGAVLGATRSSQQEVGVTYSLTPGATLTTAGFEIRKPYFALDARGLFTNLGEERHRGVEISLNGQVSSGLSLVAGAMLLAPEVTANSAAESIGRRAIGQPGWVAQLSVDYRMPRLLQLSVDCTVGARGSEMARVDNRAEVPGYTTLDLGMRYRLSLGRVSPVLRVQLLNATNTYNWFVGGDGGLQASAPRRVWAYLITDF
jgi:iron complex outermembrane receptor protein